MKIIDLPVHKLIGAARDKVKAYASTMCGDDLKGSVYISPKPGLDMDINFDYIQANKRREN